MVQRILIPSTPAETVHAARFAQERFLELGVEIRPSSRLALAMRDFETFAERPWNKESTLAAREQLHDDYVTITEFFLIANTLHGPNEPDFLARLAIALKGHRLEGLDKKEPRSFQFELFARSILKLGGLHVESREPDLFVYDG